MLLRLERGHPHLTALYIFRLQAGGSTLTTMFHDRFRRNRAARQSYRLKQAYIKGSSRRKIGKLAKADLEARRKAELDGERM